MTWYRSTSSFVATPDVNSKPNTAGLLGRVGSRPIEGAGDLQVLRVAVLLYHARGHNRFSTSWYAFIIRYSVFSISRQPLYWSSIRPKYVKYPVIRSQRAAMSHHSTCGVALQSTGLQRRLSAASVIKAFAGRSYRQPNFEGSSPAELSGEIPRVQPTDSRNKALLSLALSDVFAPHWSVPRRFGQKGSRSGGTDAGRPNLWAAPSWSVARRRLAFTDAWR